jgi:hypothetical protein
MIENLQQRRKNMKIIKQTNARALVLHNEKYYVVSQSDIFGPETLIFPSNEQGKVTSWVEVGGGRSLTLSEVLQSLEKHLF